MLVARKGLLFIFVTAHPPIPLTDILSGLCSGYICLFGPQMGPHTIDRFACHYNSKLVLFNSKFFQPGTSGAIAFSQDWAFANNCLCPPTYLTVRVVNHLKICKAALHQGRLLSLCGDPHTFGPLFAMMEFTSVISCMTGVFYRIFLIYSLGVRQRIASLATAS